MLQSIHAILHNILFLQGYSTVLDSAHYSNSTMFMRTDLLPSILISEFYIQLASSFHMKCTVCRNNILLGELQFFNRLLPDYIQSTCTQTTCSLHPSSLQLNQPTRNFLLGEYAHSTRRNQDKNSTRRSLNATGI